MIDELIRKHRIISDQVDVSELRVILTELQNVLNKRVKGDVVELGCYTGTTSLFIQRLLLLNKSQAKFHVYDSFQGLPEKSPQDDSPAGEQFTAGELKASKKEFVQNFRQASLPPPIIHAGWFSDLDYSDIPEQISFAFLDGDFYESIMDSFLAIQNNLAVGATIVVDDYQSESLPGAARAVRHWLKDRPHKLRVEASLAIISI
ncbi:class I SAM-dependent methyltransferase [Candidatus Saccharibacteria bacterium]|nr:class I SAM-dependent methyltransferase [Candidatus Saccharibacteria bacterium]